MGVFWLGKKDTLLKVKCLLIADHSSTLIQELSQVVTVMEFDFSRPISPCQGKAKVCVL